MSNILGKLEVKTVREGEGLIPMQLAVPGVTDDDLSVMKTWYWSEELSVDARTAIFRIEVRSYVLNVDGLNVLIDTCCGNDKQRSVPWAHRLQTRWLQNLAGAGCGPDEFFGRRTHEAHNREAYVDSVLPVVEAGLADIVDSDVCVHREIEDGIWLEDAAGHSPGSVVVNARRGGSRAVFMGDIVHHPIQLVRPDLPFFADENPAEACVTRQRLLGQCVDNESVLFPAHFPDPPSGRVSRAQRHFSYGFL
jgi:hypothetical protein